MRKQEVNVDVPLMVTTAMIYLGLAASGWILFRLIQACFWLPGYLKTQDDTVAGKNEPLRSDVASTSGSESEEDKKNV